MLGRLHARVRVPATAVSRVLARRLRVSVASTVNAAARAITTTTVPNRVLSVGSSAAAPASASATSVASASARAAARQMHASALRASIGGVGAPPSGNGTGSSGSSSGSSAHPSSFASSASASSSSSAGIRTDLPGSAWNASAAASYARSGNAIDPEFPRTEPQHLLKSNIEGYGDGAFQVNGLLFKGSILAFPTFTLLWSPTTWEEVTSAHLALVPLVEPKIQMLLFGGGPYAYHPTPDVIDFLSRHNIGWEPMNTFNACATFSMLNAEERHVAAAIIAVPDKPEAQPISEERLHQMAIRERRLRGA